MTLKEMIQREEDGRRSFINGLIDETRKEKISETIRENIKRYCFCKGTSKKEIAKKAGVTLAMINNMIYGFSMSQEIIEKVAISMGISVEELRDPNFLKRQENFLIKLEKKKVEILAEKIDSHCKRENISREKFAENAGISPHYVFCIFHCDIKKLDIKKVKLIAEELGVSAEELLT